jgi:CheY-like chemotaxis protein
MPKILVVEDDLDQLQIRRQILEQAGYEVAVAQNATEAMPKIPGCRVVLMDLRLPTAEDGMQLIRAAAPVARVILLSGAEPEGPLPVDEFLRKPFSSRKLLETVARFCAPPAEA